MHGGKLDEVGRPLTGSSPYRSRRDQARDRGLSIDPPMMVIFTRFPLL